MEVPIDSREKPVAGFHGRQPHAEFHALPYRIAQGLLDFHATASFQILEGRDFMSGSPPVLHHLPDSTIRQPESVATPQP